MLRSRSGTSAGSTVHILFVMWFCSLKNWKIKNKKGGITFSSIEESIYAHWVYKKS